MYVPIQWVHRYLSLGVECLECKANPSVPSITKVKNVWSYTKCTCTHAHTHMYSGMWECIIRVDTALYPRTTQHCCENPLSYIELFLVIYQFIPIQRHTWSCWENLLKSTQWKGQEGHYQHGSEVDGWLGLGLASTDRKWCPNWALVLVVLNLWIILSETRLLIKYIGKFQWRISDKNVQVLWNTMPYCCINSSWCFKCQMLFDTMLYCCINSSWCCKATMIVLTLLDLFTQQQCHTPEGLSSSATLLFYSKISWQWYKYPVAKTAVNVIYVKSQHNKEWVKCVSNTYLPSDTVSMKKA
jgi:hypothetical protein